MDVYDSMLGGLFAGREPDITEENLQARIRGNLLMALSNKFGWLVLTTGNKSRDVGRLLDALRRHRRAASRSSRTCPRRWSTGSCDFRNARDAEHPVPQSIIERPPTAELRPDQKDADSLPDYDMLDAILEAYVEEDAGREQLIDAGLPAADVDRVHRPGRPRRVQAPPGAARHQDHAARVRPRPADADHEPVSRRLSSRARRCSIAPACR